MGRLAGVTITGEREVSHALIDVLVAMEGENQLRYVRWEQCTKRDVALMGLKTEQIWKPDACGARTIRFHAGLWLSTMRASSTTTHSRRGQTS
jgi:hypothetical protein